MQVAKRELALECDYSYEATCQERFKALVESEPRLAGGRFHVPGVVRPLCSQRVMASEWVHGVPIDKVCALPQVRPHSMLWGQGQGCMAHSQRG